MGIADGLGSSAKKTSGQATTSSQDMASITAGLEDNAQMGYKSAIASGQAVAQPVNINVSSAGKAFIQPEVNISTTDFGAIESAYQVAKMAYNSATDSIKKAIDFASGSLVDIKEAYSKSVEGVQAAYEDVSGGAENKRMFLLAGAAVLGVFFIFRKKG